MKKMNNKGFSLVELIVVIAIMAVLVGVLAPQFIKYVENSRRSTDVSSAEAIRSAVLADIADQQAPYTDSGSVTLDSLDKCPTSVKEGKEVPSIKSTQYKTQKFVVKYNSVSGTCSVWVDNYNLSDSKMAANYKNQKGATES